MSKATPKQIQCLKNYGIEAPKTKIMASRYITFIRQNNGAGPATEMERIALLKSTLKKWLGKKAQFEGHGEVTITAVLPKWEDEVLWDKRDNLENHGNPATSPFYVSHTRLENGKQLTVYTSMYHLTLLDPES